MNIKLKGVYGTSRQVEEHNRGRTYDIGIITGQVQLTENGLTIMLTDKSLAEKIKGCLK